MSSVRKEAGLEGGAAADPSTSTVATQHDDVGTSQLQRPASFSSNLSLASPGILEYAGGDDPNEADQLQNNSSSLIRFYPEWCHCCSCLARPHPLPPPVEGTSSTKWGTALQNMLLCPPHGSSANFLTFIVGFLLVVLFLTLLLLHVGGDSEKNPWRNSPAGYRGPIFALAIIELLGLFIGMGMKCFRLPSLLGPLLLGITLRNIEQLNIFNFFGDTPTVVVHWIKPIRQMALTIILTRAGIELTPKQLKKLKGVVPLMAFGPCVVEACTCALSLYLIFNVIGGDKIKIPLCFAAGFALAAVSPAVVVPGMLSLKKKNLGVAQGIPTLLIASSSIDDVLAISLHTIFLQVALAHNEENSGKNGDGGCGSHDPVWIYASGPLSVVVGLLHGLVVGMFLHFIPSRDNRSKASIRLLLLLVINFVSMFFYDLKCVEEYLGGAGSVAVLTSAFIASFGWRSQAHWKRPMHQVEKMLGKLWTLTVPLLFGTIGKDIDFKQREFEPRLLWKILLVIFISLVLRCVAAFFISGILKITWKERLFCAMAWIPKATVQATLAPLVLSKINTLDETHRDKAHLVAHGKIVLITAVVAVLITAPLGSILIAFFGPRLLRRATVAVDKIDLEIEFPNGDGDDVSKQQDEVDEEQLHLYHLHEGRTSARGSVSTLGLPTHYGGPVASDAEGGSGVLKSASADSVNPKGNKGPEQGSFTDYFVKFS